MNFRPFGRLWWDEIVNTVVTRAEPHNQVLSYSICAFSYVLGLLLVLNFLCGFKPVFNSVYFTQRKTEFSQSAKTQGYKDFLIAISYLAMLGKSEF